MADIRIPDDAHRVRAFPNPNEPFNGTCVLCYGYCNTMLALAGEPEYAAGFLIYLGVPEPEALAMIQMDELRGPTAGEGRYHFGFMVCQRCADEKDLKVANRWEPDAFVEGEMAVPLYTQPDPRT